MNNLATFITGMFAGSGLGAAIAHWSFGATSVASPPSANEAAERNALPFVEHAESMLELPPLFWKRSCTRLDAAALDKDLGPIAIPQSASTRVRRPSSKLRADVVDFTVRA